MVDRIPCINPRCRHTARADMYEPGEEIICRECFRKLPRSIAERYRALNRRERRIHRMINRRPDISRERFYSLWSLSDALRSANWRRMRAFFRPVDKPVGIDAFLEEMKL